MRELNNQVGEWASAYDCSIANLDRCDDFQQLHGELRADEESLAVLCCMVHVIGQVDGRKRRRRIRNDTRRPKIVGFFGHRVECKSFLDNLHILLDAGHHVLLIVYGRRGRRFVKNGACRAIWSDGLWMVLDRLISNVLALNCCRVVERGDAVLNQGNLGHCLRSREHSIQ